MKEQMIEYLQSMMDNFKADESKYGFNDTGVRNKLNAMIACKEMVEAILGEPVNLQIDGKVTVGFLF